MKDYSLLKINLMGGIVSPGTLQYILSAAREAGVRDISFGARQQLLMYVKAETVRGTGIFDLKNKLDISNIDFEVDSDDFPNIISSYCAEEVFPTGQWISEGIYKDIFDGFDYQPKLKVNISDFQQSFTPFFTGNLNFIASNTQNFWYLYVRPKQTNRIFRFPILIYTLEIPKISKRIEEVIWNNPEMDENEVYEKVIAQGEIISQVIPEDLKLPKFSLPYYEGFNRYGDKTWLGIYRRNETFSVDFLQDICQVCLETKVGQICITPWKSLIIKGIEKKHRNLWDELLGKHTINVRHAANELNWQVEDLSPEGLALKKSIIREFDDEDVRTFGLSFAVQTRPKSEVFGSVVIKKRNIFNGLSSVFDIYHTVDFNPNTRELILFEKGVNKAHVPEILQRLSKRFYALSSKQEVTVVKEKERKASDLQLIKVHQCKVCFTVYDERFGDSVNNIAVGVKFTDLPNDYCCPVCEAAKEEFAEVKVDALLV
ncbi:rubredoxin [Arcicella sp. LKC2W]|uniref:rubredoxin n=1 Tax=Arcicella sp. LKC2W TaxID=2984198 RepID=UPI002B21EC70|nr:rubredoxin [Arcicella sp. LKC2W]MEA5459607.1 rubredoxin [Arcicella sp. LKC2W]